MSTVCNAILSHSPWGFVGIYVPPRLFFSDAGARKHQCPGLNCVAIAATSLAVCKHNFALPSSEFLLCKGLLRSDTESLLASKSVASCAVAVRVRSGPRSPECMATTRHRNWGCPVPPAVSLQLRGRGHGVASQVKSPSVGSGRVGADGDGWCEETESSRDGGQVEWVRSRDEGGMSSGDCPRERLYEATYVPLVGLGW